MNGKRIRIAVKVDNLYGCGFRTESEENSGAVERTWYRLVEEEIPKTVDDRYTVIVFGILDDVRMVSDYDIRARVDETMSDDLLPRGVMGLVLVTSMDTHDHPVSACAKCSYPVEDRRVRDLTIEVIDPDEGNLDTAYLFCEYSIIPEGLKTRRTDRVEG